MRPNQILSLIAAITMFIDHVGVVLFPNAIWLRVIGRISFPLFAYGVATGVACTSNFKKYEMRILLTALISQPICMMAFERTFSNILPTLAYGALVLHLWKQERKHWSILLVAISLWLPLEGGTYGVLTILFFGILQKESLALGQIGLQVYWFLMTGSSIQVLSLLALPLIQKDWKIQVYLPKYALYVFYPLHLTVLFAIKQMMF
ncbi:TraX family protein [Chakrabartyella piscis]|uniref:TraX family protein n=1 Tax=Chakrabartyella piscis TaxID=2918914 RepID=UPI002958935C|nr:TraX family protein [Chakrabartyella piscis]